MITTAELEAALSTLKDISGESKIQHLVRVLDEDHDGNINVEELGEVSERTDYLKRHSIIPRIIIIFAIQSFFFVFTLFFEPFLCVKNGIALVLEKILLLLSNHLAWTCSHQLACSSSQQLNGNFFHSLFSLSAGDRESCS